MTKQKVTLSLDPILYNQFQTIKKEYGYSFSAWIDAKMQSEISNHRQRKMEKVCQLLREEYSGLTQDMTDKQMLNEIVSFFMARKFWKDDKNSVYHKLHEALDNI